MPTPPVLTPAPILSPPSSPAPASSPGRRLLRTALAGGLGLAALAVTATGQAAATSPGHQVTPHQVTPHQVTQGPATRAFGSGTMGWQSHTDSPASRATARTSARARSVTKPKGILGIDVSRYQGTVNWTAYRAAGKQFAYVKATEGTSYRNRYFSSQYNGSRNAGLYHGAYHFASPRHSSGAAQADYFVAHGGRWSRDGHTLPGVLDIEYNPYGGICYGLGKTSMVSWIKSFTTEYKKRTGRDAVIYSTTNWWATCTGNSSAFTNTNPLWIARYSSSAGTLPHNWSYYTFWQYSGTGVDLDTFNGNSSRLRALALG